MNHLEGNAGVASSSVVASSAANSSSVEGDGSGASSAPGSNPVDDGEPPEAVLQPPNTAETTVNENNKSFSVTIHPPMAGRGKLTGWVWRYVSRFAPTINDKNSLCLVKAADGTAWKHLITCSPGDSNNRKWTGTTGLANHIKKKHPTQYKEAMELVGTKERNAPAAAAIGEESRDDKKLNN